MSFGEDEEILQDFLVEAGEILDQLSEQLVELEQRPDDNDLLNAIFRGFHTVKGGAGFLQLNEMVTCCHVTENLFDILRNGKRPVTSELMDVVLQALDTVNSQFEEVQQRQPMTAPAPELLQQLERLVSCEDLNASAEVEVPQEELPQSEPSSASSDAINLSDDEYNEYIDAIAEGDENKTELAQPKPAASGSDEITEDEFDNLLDQLHGKDGAPGAAPAATSTSASEATAPSNNVTSSTTSSAMPPSSGSDEISEDEFEALLDQLHGSGNGPGENESGQESSTTSSKPAEKKPAASSTSSSGDLITDDEFEGLLDQLHGSGKGPTVVVDNTVDNTTKADAPKPPAASSKPAAASKPASTPPPPPAKPAALTKVSAAAKPAAGGAAAAPKGREVAASASAAPAAEATVRVDTQRLDDIMNMVGELVLVRNRLVRLGLDANDESLSKAVSNLDVVTADLQTAVMKTRMQPIKKVFGRFPRVVRDLARNLKKEITLDLVGEDTDLDKNLVEALADPLVHLVRNSVDHGIELPGVREENSKPRVGKVTLAAEQEGDHILLSITDDGGGMDPDKLREKAVEKGVLDQDAAARLSDVEAFNLIFAPGFSTKTEISDVSGRGVGMDVVKTKITQLNGSIDIDSKLGQGTRIAIKVPLTLAIMPTLMIMLGRQTFALPLVSVNEIFHMDLRSTNVVDGQECVTIREKAIPIFHLKRWLVKGPVSVDKPEEGHVVIVNVGTRRVGFIVDQLIGQEEVVIKPLGKMLQGTPGMAGATITGDGTIALILDVPSMLNKYAGAM